jgi:hypothetical protein
METAVSENSAARTGSSFPPDKWWLPSRAEIVFVNYLQVRRARENQEHQVGRNQSWEV